MSEKCKRGIDEKCPYLVTCKSDDTEKITISNPHIAYQIYSRAKNWTETTKTWINEERIYSCQPKITRFLEDETFYEKDVKEEKQAILEEAQKAIKELGRR